MTGGPGGRTGTVIGGSCLRRSGTHLSLSGISRPAGVSVVATCLSNSAPRLMLDTLQVVLESPSKIILTSSILSGTCLDKLFLVCTRFILYDPAKEPETGGHNYILNVIPEYGCANKRHKKSLVLICN